MIDIEKLEELDIKFELFKEKMGSTDHIFTRDTLDFLDKHRPNKAFQYWALVMLQRELDQAHTEDLASQIWDLEGCINELLGHGAAVINERDELRAKSNAVPEGFVLVPTKNVNYFSNDGENYEIHKTLAEAKHEAECAIEHYSDRLADQERDPSSDGSFNQIGYGVILAESSYTVDHVVTQDDIDKGNYSYDVGTEIMSLHLIEAQEPI